jgi:hypothetical protein
MASPTDLTRLPVVAFDRLASLADPAARSSFLGALPRIEREPIANQSSAWSER